MVRIYTTNYKQTLPFCFHIYPTPNHILPTKKLVGRAVFPVYPYIYPSSINVPKHFTDVLYSEVKKLRIVKFIGNIFVFILNIVSYYFIITFYPPRQLICQIKCSQIQHINVWEFSGTGRTILLHQQCISHMHSR